MPQMRSRLRQPSWKSFWKPTICNWDSVQESSSCHCCAPRMLVSLNQTGTPCRRSRPASLVMNARSELECDRKTSFGTRCRRGQRARLRRD